MGHSSALYIILMIIRSIERVQASENAVLRLMAHNALGNNSN